METKKLIQRSMKIWVGLQNDKQDYKTLSQPNQKKESRMIQIKLEMKRGILQQIPMKLIIMEYFNILFQY
jgi:hypothetical protein